MGIIAGVQHIDRPWRSNIGDPDPCNSCSIEAYAAYFFVVSPDQARSSMESLFDKLE